MQLRYRVAAAASVVMMARGMPRLEDYERLMARLRLGFTTQGKEGIVKARAVDDQLMRDTWQAAGYDLLPRLRSLRLRTLVLAGDHDFIPIEIAEHIADAIPNARLVTTRDCGHFAYLECADQVRGALNDLFRAAGARQRQRSAAPDTSDPACESFLPAKRRMARDGTAQKYQPPARASSGRLGALSYGMPAATRLSVVCPRLPGGQVCD